MFLPNLPFADLNDIKNNFETVGIQTGFTLQQFIAQCVGVTIVFVVLWQFAWKPVRTILEERRKTIEESLANAEKIKKELTDAEATRQAEEIIKSAREASVLERNRLMAELKRHIGGLVVQTTEKVAGKVLTAEDQARLNAETLRQLEANNN